MTTPQSKCSIILILFVISLVGCTSLAKNAPTAMPNTSVINNTPTSIPNTPIIKNTPVPTLILNGENKATDEMIAFFVFQTTNLETYASQEVIDFIGSPCFSAASDMQFIVYSKLVRDGLEARPDDNQPIKVWCAFENELYPLEKVDASISQYHQLMEEYDSERRAYSYTLFGIANIDESQQFADVYMSGMCGPTCGAGIKMRISRNLAGVWQIDSQKLLWVS